LKNPLTKTLTKRSKNWQPIQDWQKIGKKGLRTFVARDNSADVGGNNAFVDIL